MNDMVDTYDTVRGNGCSRTLVVLDEIFRTGMTKLPEYATTVCGRNISLLVSAQSKSQLDSAYGKFGAHTLRGQFDSAMLYRPAPLDTESMQFIETVLGYTSGFARSKNEHAGATSTGENEQRIPLLPAYETELIDDTQVFIKRSGKRPILAQRLDWREIPQLAKRANMKPPEVPVLPPFQENLPEALSPRIEPLSSWHFSPNLYRQRQQPHETNGFNREP